jgi:serine/threonine-protein kinase
LDYAYTEHDVIHRDLKPSNLMLSKNGLVKVLDFGIAKVLSDSKTQTGWILGAPPYMSPEQRRGDKLEPSSDIFSLGVVFHEMLTGRHPKELREKLEKNEMPDLSAHYPDIPIAIDAILTKMLEQNPKRRYQSACEVIEALETLAKVI